MLNLPSLDFEVSDDGINFSVQLFSFLMVIFLLEEKCTYVENYFEWMDLRVLGGIKFVGTVQICSLRCEMQQNKAKTQFNWSDNGKRLVQLMKKIK